MAVVTEGAGINTHGDAGGVKSLAAYEFGRA
jgi:hypothetical protein